MDDVAGQCRILAASGKAKKGAQGTLICANGERSLHGSMQAWANAVGSGESCE
jgi:hypothetical protein